MYAKFCVNRKTANNFMRPFVKNGGPTQSRLSAPAERFRSLLPG
jgi:hypothetical protein